MEYERICACALGMTFGFEPRYIPYLVEAVGSAAGVFELDSDALAGLLGPFSAASAKISPRAIDAARAELKKVEELGGRYVACTEEDFPALLKECRDYPAGLYVRSNSELGDVFNSGPLVSIVGTRDVSEYGISVCREMVRCLAGSPQRPSVVSGLAIGVDVCAHLSALSAGLPTIAVIPVGLDSIYPRRHWSVAQKIVLSDRGAVISDYPLGTPPLPVNFLRRNRIIAGLSSATVLVESKIQGGGTMTARLASGYGRTLLAVPGRIGDVRSAGCNLLIHDKLAEPVFSPESLAEDLGLEVHSRRRKADYLDEVGSFYSGNLLREDLLKAASIIKGHGNFPVDEIFGIFRTVSPQAEMPFFLTLVRTLEADGFVTIDLLQRVHVYYNR